MSPNLEIAIDRLADRKARNASFYLHYQYGDFSLTHADRDSVKLITKLTAYDTVTLTIYSPERIILFYTWRGRLIVEANNHAPREVADLYTVDDEYELYRIWKAIWGLVRSMMWNTSTPLSG